VSLVVFLFGLVLFLVGLTIFLTGLLLDKGFELFHLSTNPLLF